MYTGTQQRITKDTDYETFKQLGVNHISGHPEAPHQQWTSSNLSIYKEKVESFGLILDMIELPLSSPVPNSDCLSESYYKHSHQYR